MCCVCVCWVHDTNRLLYLVLTENTTETERKLDETNGERTGLVSGNLEKEIVSHTKITHGFKDGHSEDNWRTLCVFVCVFRIEIDGYILEWMIFFFFFWSPSLLLCAVVLRHRRHRRRHASFYSNNEFDYSLFTNIIRYLGHQLCVLRSLTETRLHIP